ncbi:macro domain-containing protein [Ditylenchus destructor]|nr:macro domain-containing protein [Ditylenchus destructor]
MSRRQVVLYNGAFQGVELSCVMGDVTESDLDAIVVSCDPEFKLNQGLVKAVAQAAGPQFSASVKTATRGSHTDVVSVAASGTLKCKHVILVPLRNQIHQSRLDSAYSIAFQQAAQLGISSLCVPPIGSGSLNMCLEDVADFVAQALQSCSDFGTLKKIQFIDLNCFSMNVFGDALKKLTTGEIVRPPVASMNVAKPKVYYKEISKSDIPKSSGSKTQEPDVCSVCLCDLVSEDDTDVLVRLNLCTHMFHKQCIELAFKSKRQCPVCMTWYDAAVGNQPIGSQMTVSQTPGSVPGHPDAKGWHVINYTIPGGTQTAEHLRPGVPFQGTHRTAYLPNNAAGTEVLKLLRIAFDRRLIFTVGDSVTSGAKNTVTWNCIHHKTSMTGGSSSFGYPDADYLDRVRDELTAVGVHKDLIDDE